MNTVTETRLRRGLYLDSVALMRLSAEIAAGDGIEEAALMMATPANLEILRAAALVDELPENIAAGDLVLAVRALDADRAGAALDAAERLLDTPRGQGGTAGGTAGAAAGIARPRTIAAAIERLTSPLEAGLALISVPGAFAATEARKAIRHGLHVMLFSDNVSLEDERALKEEAVATGRLVMGPDCGTAVIGGLPLAFANALPRGEVGIVGASGTGIQEITCLLARAGVGISHATGVGGRDLHERVGALSTLAAIDALERDGATRHIVLVAKPPAPTVAARVLERVAASDKRFTVCLLGGERPALPDNARWAETLTEAADIAAREVAASAPGGGTPDGAPTRTTTAAPNGATPGTRLRGLFCGGTLCAEAQLVLRRAGTPCSSNAPIPGVAGHVDEAGHTLIDLGADEYTRGRPHPMIEPAVRDAVLAAALADPASGVVLLDLVIGFGAHADPAGHLVASLPTSWREAPRVPIVASVTGTEDDPQVRSRQVERLRVAGIEVAASNAAAAERALALIEGPRS